jgi:predicted ATP-binding protein involved in virulence
MTPQELLRLENIFIKLKNQGKTLEEIKSELAAVDQNLIDKWNIDFEEASSKIPDKPMKTIIASKGDDGKYEYKNSMSFQMTFLQKVKFDLWRASSHKPQDESGSDFVKKAVEANRIISKYFTELDVVVTDKEKGAYNATFTLNSDEPDVVQQSKQALGFYLETFFNYDYHIQKSILIEGQSDDKYSQAEKIMPYALKQIVISKYLGIENVSITEIPIDTKWIFITGENGYGKTTFLQAIAIGLCGSEEGNRILLKEESGALISIEFKDQNQNRINNIWSKSQFEKIKNIACYGPSRLLMQGKETQNRIDENKEVTYSLFESEGLLLNIEYDLVLWYLADDKKFNIVKQIFIDLIPYIADISIINERDVIYTERETGNSNNKFEPVSFNNLASGYRSIIAMIGDMILRFFKTQPHIENPSEFSGIVLIDELDLHWHPKWQRVLPGLLSKVFPKIQFVVTTHSVIPFLGAPKESIFLKALRDKASGIIIERIDLDIKNLLPNVLLTSALFDMDSITQINNEKLSEVRTEDSYNQIERNEKAKEILKNIEGNNNKYPDNLFE